MNTLFKIMGLIEKGIATEKDVTVIDKSGKFIRGNLYDHYVRVSADKLRGKISIKLAKDQSVVEVDANDILDIEIN
jgi:hypothetical protein